MRQCVWQRLFLFCFALAFAVLLVSGAPRLIASYDEGARVQIRVRPVQAFLCSAASEQRSSQAAQRTENRSFQSVGAFLLHAASDTPETVALYADANGNVLRCASYMRSVYQVFALGDGFA